MSYVMFSLHGQDFPAYASVAEADGVLALEEGWMSLSDVQKQTHLARAVLHGLDRLEWLGVPSVEGQRGKWPREGIPGVGLDEIPGGC